MGRIFWTWFLLPPLLALPCAWVSTVTVGVIHHEILPAVIACGWPPLYGISVLSLYVGMTLVYLRVLVFGE